MNLLELDRGIFALLEVPIIFMHPPEIIRWLRAHAPSYLSVRRANGPVEDAVIVLHGTDLYLGYGKSPVFQQDFREWRHVQQCSFHSPRILDVRLGDEIRQHERLAALNSAGQLDQNDYSRL